MELVARVELELAEDAGEVALHGSRRDEERLRDLAVRPALARQLGDPKLARRQRIDSGQDDATRTRAGGTKLRLRLFGKKQRPASMRGVKAVAKHVFRLRASISTPQHRAEVDEGPRSLQLRVTTFEGLYGFAKQTFTALSARDDAGRATGYTDRTRRTERMGKLELFRGQSRGSVLVAERAVGEIGL